MKKEHEELAKMFPFFQKLTDNRQTVLCAYFKATGFLGLVKNRGIMVAAQRGNHAGVCHYLTDKKHKERYLKG